jgi:hypothetical protein
VRRLIEDMLAEQTAITQPSVLKFAANAQAGDDEASAKAAVASWAAYCARGRPRRQAHGRGHRTGRRRLDLRQADHRQRRPAGLATAG